MEIFWTIVSAVAMFFIIWGLSRIGKNHKTNHELHTEEQWKAETQKSVKRDDDGDILVVAVDPLKAHYDEAKERYGSTLRNLSDDDLGEEHRPFLGPDVNYDIHL